jgi:hypothetical protein
MVIRRTSRGQRSLNDAIGLVLTGIAFLTGFLTHAGFWLLEAFPALGRIG